MGQRDSSDRELLEAWSAGDQAAAGELIRRHSDDLYAFFVSKVGGDAEDLMQQALLGCLEVHERGGEIGNFRGLLFSVARRRLIDHFRKRGRADVVELDSVPLSNGATRPSQRIARTQDERVVLEALRGLPLDSALLIELYYWHGLTGRELAEAMEIAEGTVRGRIRKAKHALSMRIEELEGCSAPLDQTLTQLADWRAPAGPGDPG